MFIMLIMSFMLMSIHYYWEELLTTDPIFLFGLTKPKSQKLKNH